MSAALEHHAWLESNHDRITALLEALRRRLDARTKDQPLPPAEQWPPTLEALAACFGLSRFEQLTVMLCAGTELDASFARACAEAGDSPRAFASFGLALATLPEPHWSALSPAGPLRRWRLAEPSPGEALTTGSLRVDERVLHYLTGVSHLDQRLEGLLGPARSDASLPGSHQTLAEECAAIWARSEQRPLPVLQLCGRDRDAKPSIAAAACAALELGLFELEAGDIPHTPGDRTALARLCERELALSRSALLLVSEGDLSSEAERHGARFAAEMGGPLLIASPEALPVESRARLRLEVSKPDHAEQRLLWCRELGSAAAEFAGDLDVLVSQFDLDTQGIRAASELVTDTAADGVSPFTRLWDACRVQARRKLDGMAQRIESQVGWEDLVLPAAQLGMLNAIAVHLRQSETVYEKWGFASKSKRGLGMSALFAGGSGTGKTLAAEVIANELRLDLYRIDLSQVVSKYIGETEKNLGRIFEAAEASGAILLFDEADALFGKRSEVRDSHDRYANIEVSYLLQRMEAYRGLAILTTNQKSALDQAFLRRIRFVVPFPFPDAVQREELWRRVFPERTPTADLDPQRLARMNVTGGNIRNIAVNAAFLAAAAGVPVNMDHIARAAHVEYAKLEKSLTLFELGGRA